MIKVNIKKDYGNFKLNVNFESKDETLGLLGASGSGKSLTLKCIAGIETPDQGQIILNDRVLFDKDKKINLKPQDRNVGYLFQDYALFPNMTILENIKTGIREKISFREKDLISRKIIEELGLIGLEDNMPFEISGGEKQRVALGRILVNRPEILLLDEPFSALDDYLKWKIELRVKEIIRKYQLPSIFVSHSRDEVYRICDSICIVENGKSEEKQDTKDLFKSPKTMSAALISGCKNFSYIEKLSKDKVLAKDWGLVFTVLDLKDEDLIGVRAHYIDLVTNPGENTFEIDIIQEIDEVFSTALMVKTLNSTGNFGEIRIEINKEKWIELKKNDKLYGKINPTNIMLLKSKE